MKMKSTSKRRLGHTDLHLSALGLGTAGLGELFEPVDENTAQATLQTAWKQGCRYFDTSPFYGHGQAEIRTGRGLYRKDRDDLVVSSKVGRLFRRPKHPDSFVPDQWIGGLPFEIKFDYSYDGIMRSVEDSYLRLGMNRIDVLLIHDLDTWFHPDSDTLEQHRKSLLNSGWKALEELKSSGVVGAIGAGLNDRETFGWYLDHCDVDCFLLALRYSLLDHDVLDEEFKRCESAGIGIVVGGAFSSGILATGAIEDAKYNYEKAPDDILAKVRRIEAVCCRYDTPLAAAALQFSASHPLVASVVVGALSPAHVDTNISAFETEIPADLWAELKSEGLLPRHAPVPDQHHISKEIL
ncbi:aldo/keto reductase [Pacificibacter marinus]|uniref:aldo/keto reductase n=1 Tax=Pacificibacter marinus TaxID=658057 RepID=UPI001C07DD40|nr:aldo/keto reductase [Pacificibacter marinus]MBU2868423.1 aldo/keto reductase [Pacificibacter marinus]